MDDHALNAPIRIVLADDHPVVLMGLDAALAHPEFRIVASVADGIAALAAIRAHRPDVLILDLQMPRMDGYKVLEELRKHDVPTRVIVLTGSGNAACTQSPAKLGVAAVLSKSDVAARLLDCVREVHAGRRWPQTHQQAAVESESGVVEGLSAKLTPRELEIAQLVAMALPNKTIANRLGITEGTVKVHLHRIYEALSLRGRMDLLLLVRGDAAEGSQA